jgi:gamma-glutamyltranspeptidase/glutathione hydrolase
VKIESRVDQAVSRTSWQKRGHDVRVVAPYDQDVGGGQAVMRDYATGVNFGASDPRKDGAAIPEPYGKSSRR